MAIRFNHALYFCWNISQQPASNGSCGIVLVFIFRWPIDEIGVQWTWPLVPAISIAYAFPFYQGDYVSKCNSFHLREVSLVG